MENNKELSEIGNLLPVDLYEKIQVLAEKKAHSVGVEIVCLLRNAVEQKPDSDNQGLPSVDDIDPKEATMNAAGSNTSDGIDRL